jgi:hypothetical protein
MRDRTLATNLEVPVLERCPHCDLTVLFSTDICPNCAQDRRVPVDPNAKAERMAGQQKPRTIGFGGTAIEALGWGLYALLLSLLVIPAAWGAAALYRWFVKHLRFSDGTQASFEGRGSDVWGYFILGTVMGFVPMLSKTIEDPVAEQLGSFGLQVLILPISAFVWWQITRWFFSKIRLSCGTTLRFAGGYVPYLGWTLLATVSVFTIIGWAWAYAAMLRWVCTKVEGGRAKLIFTGSGWGFLWRAVVASLASMAIIPIPWVWLWFYRWIIESMVITAGETE